MSRRRLPPRPDVPRAAVGPDRTLWFVGAVFAVAIMIAGTIVANPPPPSVDTRQPSVLAQTVPTGPDGPYAFLEATYVDGRFAPVRWNPCQPIDYQVNLEAAPLGMSDAIAGAIRQASDATGIAFRSRGSTSRDARGVVAGGYFANPLRSIYRPVVIDVVTHREFRSWGQPARVVAFAHPQPGNGDLNHQYVAGYVVVDGQARYAPTGRWSMELVVLHELGHLLGLAHVTSPSELMFSAEVARHTIPEQLFTWGSGDLEGLERLGADQGCLERVKIAG
jgi:Matrixin